MAINKDLLVAGIALQDFLVNKEGTALINGTVTCYQDNSRTTLKNWYYQTGSYGNYKYLALPNPMTLSAAGTICDAQGNDVIPLFYPYNETDNQTEQTYYITVYDSDDTLQFTRANFPLNFVAITTDNNSFPTEYNLIVNNRFWRNKYSASALSITANSSDWSDGTWTYEYDNSGDTFYYATLAPSQHDGFSMPDLTYVKDSNTSQESIQFVEFEQSDSSILSDDVTPQYYIQHQCTVAGSNQSNWYQFPISYQLLSLSNFANAIFTIQLLNNTVSQSGTVNVYLYQFVGSGGTSPSPNLIGSVNANSSWSKQTFTFNMPPTNDVVLSSTADSALYLQIELPQDELCNISFTLPSVFLNTAAPTNDFATYDQIDAVIGTNRTGDIRMSLNKFYPFGWLPMNDGTIGNESSNATALANNDSWPLFNLLWTLFAPYSSPGSGTTNPICQMYNSSGTPVGYGPNITIPTTALSDWQANNQLSLTAMMGQVIMGTAPMDALLSTYTQNVTATQQTQSFTASASGNSLLLTLGLANPTFVGETFQVSNVGGALPTGLTVGVTYYAVPNNNTTLYAAVSYADALAGIVLPYVDAGTGANTLTITDLILTSSTALDLFPGVPVVFTQTGTLPSGLTTKGVYYALPISSTTFAVATSFANAISGQCITYTDAGSGVFTVFVQIAGTRTGEYDHTQLNPELPAHTHSATSSTNLGLGTAQSPGGGGGIISSGALPGTWAVSSTVNDNFPNGVPFNIVQPSTFLNIYIKL